MLVFWFYRISSRFDRKCFSRSNNTRWRFSPPLMTNRCLEKHFWSNLDGAQWKLFHHGKKCNHQTKNVLHSFNIKAIEKLGIASSKKNALNKSNHDKKNEEFSVLNHIKYSQAYNSLRLKWRLSKITLILRRIVNLPVFFKRS